MINLPVTSLGPYVKIVTREMPSTLPIQKICQAPKLTNIFARYSIAIPSKNQMFYAGLNSLDSIVSRIPFSSGDGVSYEVTSAVAL